MTAMPCTRRGAHQPGSSTWVRPQARHRARTGLSLACVPPGRVITRWRACPHGPSRPRPHGQTDGQRHVHTQIDSAALPMRHQTRRQGRPYTLVLAKTGELFTREQGARHKAVTDLEWLTSAWGDGPPGTS